MGMQQIGRYRIVEEFGRRDKGVVYLAVDPDLNRRVALETFSPPASSNPEDWQLFAERVLLAAKRAGSLIHPNISATYDAFTENGITCVVTEPAAGPSLEQILSEQGRLDPQMAIQVIREAAAGLDYANRQGVVHQ